MKSVNGRLSDEYHKTKTSIRGSTFVKEGGARYIEEQLRDTLKELFVYISRLKEE